MRDIVEDFRPGFHWEEAAVDALHEMTEAYMIEMFAKYVNLTVLVLALED